MAGIKHYSIFLIEFEKEEEKYEVITRCIPRHILSASSDDPLNDKLSEIEEKGRKKFKKKYPHSTGIFMEEFDEGTKEDGEELVDLWQTGKYQEKKGLVIEAVSIYDILGRKP